jgi:hypothetical protein
MPRQDSLGLHNKKRIAPTREPSTGANPELRTAIFAPHESERRNSLMSPSDGRVRRSGRGRVRPVVKRSTSELEGETMIFEDVGVPVKLCKSSLGRAPDAMTVPQ